MTNRKDFTTGGGGGGLTGPAGGAVYLAVFLADGAEAGNQIVVSIQIYTPSQLTVGNTWDTSGTAPGVGPSVAFASNLFELQVRVSDSAASYEPSDTATLSIGGVGTVLAGSGTGTVIARTDATGKLQLAVSEAAAGHRYIWVCQAGNSRAAVVARDAVHDIIFT